MPILVMPLSVQPVGLTYGAIRRTVMKLISRTYARRPDSVINSIGLLTRFCRELRWRHLLICVIGKKITTRWQYHSYSSSCNKTTQILNWHPPLDQYSTVHKVIIELFYVKYLTANHHHYFICQSVQLNVNVTKEILNMAGCQNSWPPETHRLQENEITQLHL